MQNYTNGILRCRTPRPPQLQSFTIPKIQARSSSVHHTSGAKSLGPSPDPQVEEAESPFYDPQLNEIYEQSPLLSSYENGDCGSQSSTNYSAEEPPYMSAFDGAQGYMPWRSPFSQPDYLVGAPQRNEVFQTGGYSRSVDRAFQQQGNQMVATSALDLGDNSRHIIPRKSSAIVPPAFEPHSVDRMSRDFQATSRTGRYSSGERPSHLDTSNLATIQTPSESRSFASSTNTGDLQVNPLEQATAGAIGPSLVSPFDDGVLDWPSGNGRIDMAGIHRSSSVDSGFPDNATSRAHNSHIGPSVSVPRRNSQSPYQSFAQHHRAPAFQPQAQGARRSTRGPPSLTQEPSMISYGMQSLDNDEFARNAQELIDGVQADNPLAGNQETYLYPTWKPADKAPSETHCDDTSDVSDDEVRQQPHIAPGDQHRVPTRGSKREYSPDLPSPTTTPTRNKRPKRKFTKEEKAEISQKRKTGVCNDCRRAKRRVCESL